MYSSYFWFETFTESHYSQTSVLSVIMLFGFETFTESHYSQTHPHKRDIHRPFETFTESHYSQTPNTSSGFQSLSSHHQV